MYLEGSDTWIRVLETPFAVAGDTVMVGGVAAVASFLLWVQGGAPTRLRALDQVWVLRHKDAQLLFRLRYSDMSHPGRHGRFTDRLSSVGFGHCHFALSADSKTLDVDD